MRQQELFNRPAPMTLWTWIASTLLMGVASSAFIISVTWGGGSL